MKIDVKQNKIVVEDCKTFNIKKCLECGQIFRYKEIDGSFFVFETDNKIEIKQSKEKIEIFTKQPKRHLNYFDLLTDYDKINSRISKINPLIAKAVDFGCGIRIFKQDFLEMLISFIISANNNIPRIKKSLFLLCERFGENKKDYFAFPKLDALLGISKQQWVELGVGYRAQSLVKVCQQLKNFDFKALFALPTKLARKQLISLAGVGPKVADCVLLFALSKNDVFPTDVWIKKVYQQNFGENLDNAKKISEILAQQFKEDSGLIQQYLFYFKREKGDL